MLDTETWAKAASVLLVLLLALWAAARAIRDGRLPGATGRRLMVEEAVALDARRRLVLVRCDGRELLLVTGAAQDTVVGWLPPRPGA